MINMLDLSALQITKIQALGLPDWRLSCVCVLYAQPKQTPMHNIKTLPPLSYAISSYAAYAIFPFHWSIFAICYTVSGW